VPVRRPDVLIPAKLAFVGAGGDTNYTTTLLLKAGLDDMVLCHFHQDEEGKKRKQPDPQA
jgi:hypothetical protein